MPHRAEVIPCLDFFNDGFDRNEGHLGINLLQSAAVEVVAKVAGDEYCVNFAVVFRMRVTSYAFDFQDQFSNLLDGFTLCSMVHC